MKKTMNEKAKEKGVREAWVENVWDAIETSDYGMLEELKEQGEENGWDTLEDTEYTYDRILAWLPE